MALPSAQLGSLSSLSVPSYYPAPQQRQPGIWQQALASFLAQTAGNVGSAVVGNEFARDNAAEFGKTPSTGWDRLVHGPSVDDRTAAQYRTEAGATGRSTASNKNAMDIAALNEGGANTRSTADRASRESEGALGRTATASEGALSRTADAQNIANQIRGRLDEETLRGKFAEPLRAAQILELGQQGLAEQSRGQLQDEQRGTARMTNQILDRQLNPTAPAKSTIDPDVKALHGQLGTARNPIQAQPVSQADRIQQMLDAGLTPDEIVQSEAEFSRKIAPDMTRGNATDAVMRRLHPELFYNVDSGYIGQGL